ncbi:hypothetical protein [Clostridium thailandense]|uniref:hypothetical protein n=1 Tax=Clostridium thailandense TaxID=2794346 RepID=UPI001FEBACDD|nr:hypothetical protein [Clostridium thailandense]
MNIDELLICPKCNNNSFNIKREATYVYTYKLNTPDTKLRSDNKSALPFLFDNREKTCSKEYLECTKCGAHYPCPFFTDTEKIDLTILQKAIRSDFKDEPEFFG